MFRNSFASEIFLNTAQIIHNHYYRLQYIDHKAHMSDLVVVSLSLTQVKWPQLAYFYSVLIYHLQVTKSSHSKTHNSYHFTLLLLKSIIIVQSNAFDGQPETPD